MVQPQVIEGTLKEITGRLNEVFDDNDRLRVFVEVDVDLAAGITLPGSTTEFPDAVPSDNAQSMLDTDERITLSERDFARFVASIENPEPPTPELTSAMAEYRRLKAANPHANL
ncbi:MAG: DUF1778 domain-containing protein [Capsulimonadaceae bacterium]